MSVSDEAVEAAAKPLTGWALAPNVSRKWHYFNGNRVSICGRVMYLGTYFENDADNSPDNCAACRKRRAALAAKGEG